MTSLTTSQSTLVDTNDLPAEAIHEWHPTIHQRLIIYMLGMISLIVSLDASIIPTTLSAMASDLGAKGNQAFWIGTSYLLVNAVTMPFICSISDIFGRPICFQFSLLMFVIGTILCCTTHGINQMLVGRCIQGVGGAGVHALGLVILTDIVPLRFRPKWYGVILGGWAIGLSMGPLIGGAIVKNTTWRVAFYIMFPICVLGLLLTPFLLTLKPRKVSWREKFAKVDWIGGSLFTASATSFLIGVSWGGVQYDWNSYQTIAPIITGVLGMTGTIFYENHWAQEPYLCKSLWSSSGAIITYINGCLQGFVILGYLYHIPFFFMSVKGDSTLDAGINVLPLLLITLVSAIATGAVVTRVGNYRWAICIGWLMACIGSSLVLYWPTNSSVGVWVPTQIVLGVGTGAVLNAQNFACQAMCGAGDEGPAAAMYLFARQFGFALGVGIGGTTFQNVMALKLRWEGLDESLAQEAEGYVSVLNTMPDGTPGKSEIIDAYKLGFVGCFAVYLGVSVIASILSILFVKQVEMNKAIQSEHQLHEKPTILKGPSLVLFDKSSKP
ncbi:major facilitator superfamily transporter [Xylariales sp. PMI_506]|nr:major facilitator superfamily transporter [Xylariales sp. PMI_506]